MEEYRPTVGQIITMFRFEYFPSPSETPMFCKTGAFYSRTLVSEFVLPTLRLHRIRYAAQASQPAANAVVALRGVICRTVFRFCSSRKAAEPF